MMSGTKSKTVLVVEDEAALRDTLLARLQSEGYQTFEAADGQAGLQQSLVHHPDLILLDLMLPKSNGFQMLEQLRKDAWGQTATVIVLTNNGTVQSVNKSLEDIVKVYLIKVDTTLEDVMATIRTTLGAGG